MDLVDLDPERFDTREHAALAWVRSFLTCADGVPDEVTVALQASFTPREIRQVQAAMKGMFCVNLSVSTGRSLLQG